MWDISEPGWVPDWYGNNGRSFIEPLFDGRKYGPNSVDYGDYNSPAVNALIDQALATERPAGGRRLAPGRQADHEGRGVHPVPDPEGAGVPLQPGAERDLLAVRPDYDVTKLWVSGLGAA